jgi:hypothetical protein
MFRKSSNLSKKLRWKSLLRQLFLLRRNMNLKLTLLTLRWKIVIRALLFRRINHLLKNGNSSKYIIVI